jgi:hypothetical protein
VFFTRRTHEDVIQVRRRALIASAVAVAVLGCRKEQPSKEHAVVEDAAEPAVRDLAPSKEISGVDVRARLGGPVRFAASYAAPWHLVTLTNTGERPLYARLGRCTLQALAPGARAACSTRIESPATFAPEDVHASRSATKSATLVVKDASIRAKDPGRYDFRAVIVNDSTATRMVDVRYLAVDAAGAIVGGDAAVHPAKQVLAPKEETVVSDTFFVIAETPAGASLAPREIVARGEEMAPAPAAPSTDAEPRAEIVDLRALETPTLTEYVGTLRNLGKSPIFASAKVYFKDAAGRTIGSDACSDEGRLMARVSIAPGEKVLCAMEDARKVPESWAAIEVVAGDGVVDPATLAPLVVRDVDAKSGTVRGRVANTTKQSVTAGVLSVRLIDASGKLAWFASRALDVEPRGPLAPGASASFVWYGPTGDLPMKPEVAAFAAVAAKQR